VCAAIVVRLAVGGTIGLALDGGAAAVILPLMAGSVTSAFATARAMARLDERVLHGVVRALLLGIGALLIVAVGRQWVRLEGRDAVSGLVIPMGAGSIVGAAVGAILAGHAPARLLKLVLGTLLIVSALRLLRRLLPAASDAPARAPSR
jgi:uncharacterized protein